MQDVNKLTLFMSRWLQRTCTEKFSSAQQSKEITLLPHILQQHHIFLLTLLPRCSSTKSLRQIHAQMLTTSSKNHNHLLSRLIFLRDFSYSFLLFSHLPNPNIFSFNIMIRASTKTWRKFHLSLSLYYSMNSYGIPPTHFTFPFIFISCSNLSALKPGEAAQASVFKWGLHVDSHVKNSLITFYCSCGIPGYAYKVFDEMSVEDLVSWNSLICGYTKLGLARDAIDLFFRMMEVGFEPDEMTFVSVLVACGRVGDLGLGRWIEGSMVEKRMKMNSFLGSSLIGMYSDCGDLVCARKVFDGISERDGVVWNAMISGYAQNGFAEDAIRMFEGMVEDGVVDPGGVALVGVLSACASVGSLGLGRWIEGYARDVGLLRDVYVSTALVDMYAKCGCVEDAIRVFESMGERNEVSWNTMISALALHGRAGEALSKFERMVSGREGVLPPNDVTFVAALSACVHAGMVDYGLRLFYSMGPRFGLVPKIEHFSCVVDLLARVGRVDEAWEFVVRGMPERVDEITLGALLGACQKSKNVDVSEKALRLLRGVEGCDSGNYVVSSKIYANLKRWDECANMRKLMKDRGIMKTPGCSWIEIRGKLHEFHAGDRQHRDLKCIYRIIHFMYVELEKEGYHPNIFLQ